MMAGYMQYMVAYNPTMKLSELKTHWLGDLGVTFLKVFNERKELTHHTTQY